MVTVVCSWACSKALAIWQGGQRWAGVCAFAIWPVVPVATAYCHYRSPKGLLDHGNLALYLGCAPRFAGTTSEPLPHDLVELDVVFFVICCCCLLVCLQLITGKIWVWSGKATLDWVKPKCFLFVFIPSLIGNSKFTRGPPFDVILLPSQRSHVPQESQQAEGQGQRQAQWQGQGWQLWSRVWVGRGHTKICAWSCQT